MGFLIIKCITAVTPNSFLPAATKMVDGVSLNLNTQERREFLERNLTHHLDQFLNKYSPIRRSIKIYKEWWFKRKQNQFYCLIGKIALTHAGIEQDLKNTLMVDWEVKEEIDNNGKKVNIDKLYGYFLRKIFLKLLNELLIPKKKLKEYKDLCNDFEKLSVKRNNTLKAIYSFNQDTAEVSKIHEKNHGKYDESITFEEMINLWMPKVDLTEFKELYGDLVELRKKFMNVRSFIFSDKIKLSSELCSEIGKTYPAYALKNPYWYRESLKK